MTTQSARWLKPFIILIALFNRFGFNRWSRRPILWNGNLLHQVLDHIMIPPHSLLKSLVMKQI